jgi:hypothetical protein
MDADRKDFLLHLYDKLWENTTSKENRLWSFLSFYGAALALAFAGGQVSGQELPALIVVIALTLWAALIVLNANWWYARNHLMVTRVESAFGGARDGIIPESYRDPKFRLDGLHRGSIIVLGTVSGLLYVTVMWRYMKVGSIETWFTLGVIIVAYVLFSLSIRYVVREHERHLRSYFEAKQELWREANRAAGLDDNPAEIATLLLPQQIQSRRETKLRWVALALFTAGTIGFGAVSARNQEDVRFALVSGVLVLLILVICIRRNVQYLALDLRMEGVHEYHFERVRNEGRLRGRWFMVVLSILFSLSVAVNAIGVAKGNPRLHQDAGRLASGESLGSIGGRLKRLEDELEKTRREVAKYEREDVATQTQLLSRRLDSYVTREEEAVLLSERLKGYMTEDDVRRLFEQLRNQSRKRGDAQGKPHAAK